MSKGFTLLELIIVIGILAILGAVSVLVLNPAQLFAQARDSQRISDLASVQTAIALYLSTVSSPTLGTIANCTATAATAVFNGEACGAVVNVYTVDSNGWVGVNLGATEGGSPMSTLPKDPTNSVDYFYAYKGNNTDKTFELNARLESTKFRDKMVNDGGDDNAGCATSYTNVDCYYEIGTEPGLDL